MVVKYEVKVICGPEIYDKRKKLDENNKYCLDDSIKLFRVNGADLDKNTTKGKALSFLLMSKRLYVMAKSHISKEDKVLMVTNPAPLILLMDRLKQRIGFEWHILIHDVFPENIKPAGLKLPLYRFVKHIFDRAYSKADHLIALGRDMAEVLHLKIRDYSSASNASPHISIIENWADIENIKPMPMPKGKIILEYAGNIGRVQGLDKVIQELPDEVELHLYGTGSMEERLKAMNHKNVFFHGPYFRSQQNEILSACHIAIVTLQDGMYGLGVPSKTYNILASGRPVLFFGPKNSEIDRLVKENGIGYCGWPESWNKEKLIAMGQKAREIAVRDYSEERILKKFVESI